MKRTGSFSKSLVLLAELLTVAALGQLTGCSDSGEGVLKPNQPPTVWLSSAPPEGSVEGYNIKMFWGGWDPDGEIAYYEYLITNNKGGTFDPADTTGRGKWSKVFGNDSTFSFSADQLVDPNTKNMVTEFKRSHTFFIRAVDGQGLASRRPEYRSFTARTLSPRVNVLVPPGGSLTPAFVPPITTFRWVAEDYIDDLTSKIEPDSVSWILEPTANHNQSYDQTTSYIRKLPVDSPKWNEWGGWKWYGAPQDSGKFWTSPPLDFEPYIFAVRAKDEAGAITPVFDTAWNVRRVQVSERTTGPVFKVRNQYLGTVTTAICHEPVTILDLPAGVPVDFCWEASAETYGGIVTGYRYGWDIEDLADPDQWETDYTPFTSRSACSPARIFYFGTHTFTVEVIDNSGYCSRVEVKINIVQFTMENSLLVIDDYREGTVAGWDDPAGPGVTPNDAQHDQFWETMLSDLSGFNARSDVLQVNSGDVIPLTFIANYKSIIWSVFGIEGQEVSRPVLNQYIEFSAKTGEGGGGGKRQPNILALFLAAGGHLLINGNHPVSQGINLDYKIGMFRYPLIFLYELLGDQRSVPNANTPLVGDESFMYRELCLETLEFAFTNYQRRRDDTIEGNCEIDQIRRVPLGALKNHTMRAAIPVDQAFPRLDLRIEAAGTDREYNPDKKGLDAEVYNPPYFQQLCPNTPRLPRACFEPIYALECLDHMEVTYGAPVAFWTSAFADRIGEGQGAVAARSAVFGFPLVYFNPDQVRGAIEHILYDEWQLPRE